MTLLIAGVGLFALIHFLPIFGRGMRGQMMERLGENGYKGIYSLMAIGSLVLVYFGWTGVSPMLWYDPPAWAFHVTPLVVLFAFISFFSSRAPTNIKRFVRHPQLTGVFLWGIGHLLANGEDRSVILFGGFAAWALIAMVGSNRRDGEWVKPEKQPVVKDVITVLIGVGLYAAFVMAHEYLIGVSPLPMA